MEAGRTGRTVVAALAVVALLVATLSVPAGAIHDADRRFVVELREDGNASVTVERRYNLSVAAERETFMAYSNNSTRLAEWRETVATRLERAAANGTEDTVRQMRIENVRASTDRVNGTGTVAVKARWVDLAGVYGGLVVVNEPFASSFDPNGTLVVRGPSGYIRESVNPPPAIARKNSAFWAGDSDLSGFTARFQNPQATTDGGGDGGDGNANAGNRDTPRPDGVGRLVGAATIAFIPALLVVLGVQRRRLMLAEGDTATEGDGDADDAGGGDDGGASAGDGGAATGDDDESATGDDGGASAGDGGSTTDGGGGDDE